MAGLVLSRSTDSAAGCLIIGHGTRDPRGLAEFEQLVDLAAREFAPRIVGRGYLELAKPTIPQAIAQLVERDVRRIDVLPLLLFAAGHMKQDIPELLEQSRRSFPQVEIVLHSALGCHPQLVDLSADRFRAVVASAKGHAAADTALVLIGRGSLDADATADMHRFASLRCQRVPVASCHVGFVAMAQPSLATSLEAAVATPAGQIVVQPHLLFSGQLLDEVARAVAEVRLRHPERRWLFAERLGVDRRLVECWTASLSR